MASRSSPSLSTRSYSISAYTNELPKNILRLLANIYSDGTTMYGCPWKKSSCPERGSQTLATVIEFYFLLIWIAIKSIDKSPAKKVVLFHCVVLDNVSQLNQLAPLLIYYSSVAWILLPHLISCTSMNLEMQLKILDKIQTIIFNMIFPELASRLRLSHLRNVVLLYIFYNANCSVELSSLAPRNLSIVLDWQLGLFILPLLIW